MAAEVVAVVEAVVDSAVVLVVVVEVDSVAVEVIRQLLFMDRSHNRVIASLINSRL